MFVKKRIEENRKKMHFKEQTKIARQAFLQDN